MSTLRAGVIGLGVGEQHALAYAAHPGAELSWICDSSAARVEQVAERFPDARTTTDARQLIEAEDVDVVSVASFDADHHAQVIAALGAGKHVFVEKPPFLTAEQGAELASAIAARPELRLSCNLPLRGSPRFRRVRELVAAGAFGELYHLATGYEYGRLQKLTEGWRGAQPGYSVVLGGAVHVIDLLLWISGRMAREVIAASGNGIASAGSSFSGDDFVTATLELDGGALATVRANFGSVHPHFHSLELFGTEATFINGIEAGSLYRRSAEGEVERTELGEAYPGVGKGDQVGHFLDEITGAGKAVVGESEVFATMAVCLAIERARQSGRREPVADLLGEPESVGA